MGWTRVVIMFNQVKRTDRIYRPWSFPQIFVATNEKINRVEGVLIKHFEAFSLIFWVQAALIKVYNTFIDQSGMNTRCLGFIEALETLKK